MPPPQHALLPLFGGPDDLLAFEFVVQVCANPKDNGDGRKDYKV